jgi:hypothetical protein
MCKRLGRSYVAHAVVGAILGPLVAMLAFVPPALLAKWIGPLFGGGILFVLMLIVPMIVGALMYQLRVWMMGEISVLRGVFVYSLTSATSVLWVFLFWLLIARILVLRGLQVGPSDAWIGIAGQVIAMVLAGACVSVACLAIDNKR